MISSALSHIFVDGGRGVGYNKSLGRRVLPFIEGVLMAHDPDLVITQELNVRLVNYIMRTAKRENLKLTVNVCGPISINVTSNGTDPPKMIQSGGEVLKITEGKKFNAR
jgi:hypothetical protein